MNTIQAMILRRIAEKPQWVTGFKNVKLIVRRLRESGLIIAKGDVEGGLKYHITKKGRLALDRYDEKI